MKPAIGMLDDLRVSPEAVKRIREGLRLFALGEHAAFGEHMENLRGDDPLAAELLELYITTKTRTPYPALRRKQKLLLEIARRPDLAPIAFEIFALAYTALGEVETAENYFLRCLELADERGEKATMDAARMGLIFLRFLKAEYSSIRSEIKKFFHRPTPSYKPRAFYYLAILEVIAGRPQKALEMLDMLLKKFGTQSGSGVIEMKGLAMRMMGRFDEAMDSFLEAIRLSIDLDSAAGVFPCAKALQLSRLAGIEPPPHELIRKCLRRVKGESSVGLAAAEEIQALLIEDEGEASDMLLSAAEHYRKSYQPMEACLAGLTSAWFAWRTDSSVFPKAVKFLMPLLPLHPGFRNDPLLGNFMVRVESFTEGETSFRSERGLKATLIGGFRVFLDGKEIQVMSWTRKSAIKVFVYLLLSPKHRLAIDHLFYLLWPGTKFNEKTRYRLYVAIDTIRRNLGRRDIISKKGDFYQLDGDVWTDFSEVENLTRLADATLDPAEKKDYLAQAQKLARGEFLPEFPYDRYVDEYRQYYERLRKRAFKEQTDS
ncbi:MAG: hypothetical protein ABIM88_00200 [candidate division WOR-3 bacterium]